MKSIIFITLFFITSHRLQAQQIGLELYSLRNQFKTDVPGTLAKIKSWNRSVEQITQSLAYLKNLNKGYGG